MVRSVVEVIALSLVAGAGVDGAVDWIDGGEPLAALAELALLALHAVPDARRGQSGTSTV